MSKPTLLSLFFCALFPGLGFGQEARHLQYDIDADIDPIENTMELRVLTPVTGPADEIRFLLHRDLDIDSVTGERVEAVDVTALEELMGLSPAYVDSVAISFDPPLKDGESTELVWEYRGWIETSRIQLGPGASETDWFEHDIGSLWVPTAAQLDRHFTYELSVRSPEGYAVYGAGGSTVCPARTCFETSAPGLAVSVSMARRDGFHELAFPAGRIVAPTNAPALSLLGERVTQSADLFIELLGPAGARSRVTLILPPAQRMRPGEAYARDRYFVLSHGLQPGPDRLAIAAHELAHAWWSIAPSQSQHNFLNESFAEYFAWLALEAVFGDEAFDSALAEAVGLGEGAGSIRDWTPRSNHALVYGRGPVLLHELRDRIGDEVFFRLIGAVHDRRIDHIDEFLKLIADHAGGETANWFGEAL